jgi:superfamily II DNA/RNA helicase
MVFDEADVFLESGEEAQLVRMIKSLYHNREREERVKLLFVSATLTPALRIFLDAVFDKQLKFLLTSDTHFNLANLHHDFVPIRNRNKLDMLVTELDRFKADADHFYFIVFCNSMSCVRAVTYFLKHRGFNCASLHSDMPPRLRAETHDNFKRRKINVLVCSDLAARGLDFTHLLGVVNFDFPKNANDYLHRAGRAGRIGNKGYIVSFYNNVDLSLIDRLKQSNEQRVPLELTHSSFSLTKSKPSNRSLSVDHGKLNLPASFIKSRQDLSSDTPAPFSKRRKIQVGHKTRPNFSRRKIIGIKQSIASQQRISPNGKRVRFLRREMKLIHKAELARKGKLTIPKHVSYKVASKHRGR